MCIVLYASQLLKRHLFHAEFLQSCPKLVRRLGTSFFPYDFLIFTCPFPFDCYCDNCFLSALLRWRNLWRHRYDFSRKFISCSHGIPELGTNFSINSFYTYLSRQHSVFSNSKAIMRIVQFFFEDDVLSQVRYT